MSSNDTRTRSVTETATAAFDTARKPETPHVAHDWDSHDSLLVQIIETVADETDQQQEEMEPLHTVLDVDALERLLSGDGNLVQLTFSYEGCTIIAASDGTVVVKPDR